MARVNDYVGKPFGDFVIGKIVDHGVTAEVFQCGHRTTGLVYILRLAAADRDLWSGDPVIPPRNASIEVANARGGWRMARHYYEFTMDSRRKNTGDHWDMKTVAIYGVLDQRYLVPVASPIRVKNAWDIDRVLQIAPADDLYLFEMWEEFLGSLAGAAHQSLEQLRSNDWNRLTGGRILRAAISAFLRNGTLPKNEQTAIVDAVSTPQVEGPELAENVILRICGSVQRRRMTLADAVATLRCRHFRVNVTHHECEQAVALFNVLQNLPWGAEDSLKLLQFLLFELGKAPADEYEEPEAFETREAEPDLSPYTLFLQEYAATNQEVIVLQITRKDRAERGQPPVQ